VINPVLIKKLFICIIFLSLGLRVIPGTTPTRTRLGHNNIIANNKEEAG
jgi:hypothetical protein